MSEWWAVSNRNARADCVGIYTAVGKGFLIKVATILGNFTGVDSPYESPKNPKIHIDTANMTTEGAADTIHREAYPLTAAFSACP